MATDLADRDWILLPGTLCGPEVFDGLLDALGVPSSRRRPVRLDRPEVEDYAPDLGARTDGAVICGFSLGAIVAAHHAARMRPACLILFGVNPEADDPARAAGRHALQCNVEAHGGAMALADRLPPLAGPDPAAARTAILAMAEMTGRDIAAQTRLALGRPGALPALRRAHAPVIAITGGRDRAAPPSQGRAAAAAAPEGVFAELPGLGHFALVEDPGACAGSVLSATAAAEIGP